MQVPDPVGILKDLIPYQTVNPPADTREISKYVCALLHSHGIKCRTESRDGKSVYVIAELGAGKKMLTFYAHSDVVEAGNLEKWKTDPFKPVLKHGFIYGRGATDMKGGMAAMLSAFISLSAIHNKLGGRLQLLICPDEENYVFAEKLLRKIIMRDLPSACIMGEPHKVIIYGEKSELWVTLRSKGREAHGSVPSAGKDAGAPLLSAISEMSLLVDTMNRRRRAHASAATALISDSNSAMGKEFGFTGKTLHNFILSDPVNSLIMNLGYVRIGTNINVVPAEAEARISFLLPLGVSCAGFLVKIKKIVGRYDGLFLDHSEMDDASITDPKSEIACAAAFAFERITGKKAVFAFNTAGTDAPLYRAENVPTLLLGPGHIRYAHKPNECVDVKEVRVYADIYRALALEYLGTLPP